MPLADDLKSAFETKNREKFNTILCANPDSCNLAISVKGYYYSPLHMAASLGWLDSIELLANQHAKIDLQSFEDISMPCIYSRTPLHLAASFGHNKCVAFLLQKCNANPNLQDFWGQTPLFHALGKEDNKIECVRILLEDSRTDPNIAEDADEYGNTPLHASVRNNYSQCVRLLILAGASLKIKNTEEDVTPDQLADVEMKIFIDQVLAEKTQRAQATDVGTDTAEALNNPSSYALT